MMQDVFTISAGGVAAKMIASGDSIVAHLRAGKTFEPATLERWVKLCAAGGTVLDVGAYSGLFAIFAAKVGCTVIAFEPLHHERCRENFALNGVKVDLRDGVVSDIVGPTEIKVNTAVPGMTSGASLIYPSGAGPRAIVRSRPVQSVTIDSLGLQQCTAIKIDVERAEPMVLAGARETLARLRPKLLVEVLGRDEEAAVLASVSGYKVAERLDQRNWLMLPC